MDSIGNFVLMILQHVVSSCPEVQEWLFDNADDVLRRGLVGNVRLKPVSQLLNSLAPEAGQLSVQHELNDVNDVLPVRSNRQVSVNALLHKVPELRRLHLSPHYVNELCRQFHIRLEGKVTAGGAFEDEAKICSTLNELVIMSS